LLQKVIENQILHRDKHRNIFFFPGTLHPRALVKALTRQTNDVTTSGMSEWTHRTTARKTDAPRRNQTRWIDRMKKKPALISYCPRLSRLSPFPSDVLSLSLSPLPPPLFAILIWKTAFLVVYGTFGRTRPLRMSHRDTLSKATNAPRENQTWNIDQMRTTSSSLSNVKVLEVHLHFTIYRLLRLTGRNVDIFILYL